MLSKKITEGTDYVNSNLIVYLYLTQIILDCADNIYKIDSVYLDDTVFIDRLHAKFMADDTSFKAAIDSIIVVKISEDSYFFNKGALLDYTQFEYSWNSIVKQSLTASVTCMYTIKSIKSVRCLENTFTLSDSVIVNSQQYKICD